MVAATTASDAPIPGFVVKLTAPDGTRHYVNVASHPVIERPLDPGDHEVDDRHLRTRGLENLRVPLLTGVARTVVLPGGEDEAVCIDVVFNPAVLDVAAADVGEEEGDAKQPRVKKGVGKDGDINPDLAKFVRIRVVELALKNAEEDLGYRLGRNYTLPRGVAYRGGVGGGKQPVPLPALRKLAAAVEAERRHKETAAAPGPWRSKRDAAGLANTARIEELDDYDGAKAKPLIKKGFLNATKQAIYPSGSEEGMLYGDVKVAGDPLGYLPKGLRSRVNVVDTGTTNAAAQQKLMEDYADGKKMPSANAPIKGGGGGGTGHGGGAKAAPAGGVKSGGAKGGGVAKGFLNGAGGSLYPNGSTEGSEPTDMERLRELIPSKEEAEKLAATTDPESFLSDLGMFGQMMGLSGAGAGMSAPPNPAANETRKQVASLPAEYASVPDAGLLGPQLPAQAEAEAPQFGPAGPSSLAMDISDARATADRLGGGGATGGAAAAEASSGGSGEVEPTYALAEADGVATLTVQLPELSALGDTAVDVSEERFRLHAPGRYALDVEWPRAGAADEAKAKFLKKSRTLQVTMPLVV